MKAFFLFLAVLHLSFFSFAQEVRLFNSGFYKQTSDSSSRNVRLYYLQAQPATIKDYKGDTLQMIASVYGAQTIEEIDALLKYYRNKSFLHRMDPRFYKKRVQLIRFTPEGKPLHKINGKNHQVYYEQVWDEEGNELLTKGSGFHSYIDKRNGEHIHEVYLDSLLVERYGIREQKGDTIYYHFDKAAQPKRGMRSFYQTLIDQLEYPKRAHLAQKNGTVYIQFIVDKDGELTEFTPLTENGYNLEANVLKVLKRFRPWHPAIYQGKAVKTKMILPVDFR